MNVLHSLVFFVSSESEPLQSYEFRCWFVSLSNSCSWSSFSFGGFIKIKEIGCCCCCCSLSKDAILFNLNIKWRKKERTGKIKTSLSSSSSSLWNATEFRRVYESIQNLFNFPRQYAMTFRIRTSSSNQSEKGWERDKERERVCCLFLPPNQIIIHSIVGPIQI